MVVRAIGPALALAGQLTDPALELRDAAGELVSGNDNWSSHRADVLATRLAPANEREAVIVPSLSPGAYTAIVSGVNNSAGTALVEVYDLEPERSRLANISTRGRVEHGDNVMIGGFIIGGSAPTKVIARAIGPSLHSSGVEGAGD